MFVNIFGGIVRCDEIAEVSLQQLRRSTSLSPSSSSCKVFFMLSTSIHMCLASKHKKEYELRALIYVQHFKHNIKVTVYWIFLTILCCIIPPQDHLNSQVFMVKLACTCLCLALRPVIVTNGLFTPQGTDRRKQRL